MPTSRGGGLSPSPNPPPRCLKYSAPTLASMAPLRMIAITVLLDCNHDDIECLIAITRSADCMPSSGAT
eukprot:6445268-Prymnesium_polylepis.1